jgi:hypothetical protein
MPVFTLFEEDLKKEARQKTKEHLTDPSGDVLQKDREANDT